MRVWRPKNGPLGEVRSSFHLYVGSSQLTYKFAGHAIILLSHLSGPSDGLLTLNTQLVLEGLFTPVLTFRETTVPT